MATFRIKQIGLTLCLMASLLVGSVSACTCVHHEADAQPQVPLCHQHSAGAEIEDHRDSAVENTSFCVAADDDCICAEGAQKIAAKSESTNLERHGAIAVVELFSTVASAKTHRAVRLGFVKPNYRSDPFYNLSFSRGPPARL